LTVIKHHPTNMTFVSLALSAVGKLFHRYVLKFPFQQKSTASESLGHTADSQQSDPHVCLPNHVVSYFCMHSAEASAPDSQKIVCLSSSKICASHRLFHQFLASIIHNPWNIQDVNGSQTSRLLCTFHPRTKDPEGNLGK